MARSSLRRKAEGNPNGFFDIEKLVVAERAYPGAQTRLVDGTQLIPEGPRGRVADLHSGFARVQGFDVACERKHDDPGAVPIAGIVGYDDRRPCLPDLGSEPRVERDPVDLTATRRAPQRGQSSVSVDAQSKLSFFRQRSRRAAR